MGGLDREDAENQQTADEPRSHSEMGTNWLPFTTAGERAVTSVVLIGIAACSLQFGIIGGAAALGVYALGFKLYERRRPHR